MVNNKFAIIQEGSCVLGKGETIESCIEDANNWLDDHVRITGFEPHDQRGREDGGLTDWTSGRRYPISGGDLFITDDQSVISGYEE